ncbi:MAG TPA: hypothetical protein VI504_06770 [Candidatus Eisenbacteria bacterium]
MSWIESIGLPLCPTREEADTYISSELARAAPAGWVVERFPDSGFPPGSVPTLSWRVARTQIPKGEWQFQEYDILLSASLELVIFTHSNNDIGPGSLAHSLQHARVIEAWELRRYGMAACLEHVMSTSKPNEWGYT